MNVVQEALKILLNLYIYIYLHGNREQVDTKLSDASNEFSETPIRRKLNC